MSTSSCDRLFWSPCAYAPLIRHACAFSGSRRQQPQKGHESSQGIQRRTFSDMSSPPKEASTSLRRNVRGLQPLADVNADCLCQDTGAHSGGGALIALVLHHLVHFAWWRRCRQHLLAHWSGSSRPGGTADPLPYITYSYLSISDGLLLCERGVAAAEHTSANTARHRLQPVRWGCAFRSALRAEMTQGEAKRCRPGRRNPRPPCRRWRA